jgi:hypothetical protein
MSSVESAVIEPFELPAGLHPLDQSGPEYRPQIGDQPQAWKPGTQPFAVPNSHAVAVWERATNDWAGTAWTLALTGATNGTMQIAGRIAGRKSVTIWVPSSASHGVQIAPSRGQCDNNAGVVLNPGDSITIGSEAPVYAAVISGQTAGTCNVLDLFNVPTPRPE